MTRLVTHFVLTGAEEEVPVARRMVVDRARAWGVPLNDETADVLSLVASELVTNAVVHGAGPVAVELSHQPGRLVIGVRETNPLAPQASCAGPDDESGRGLALVSCLAIRSGWEPSTPGKRVWAEIALPEVVPSLRPAVCRQLHAAQTSLHVTESPTALSWAVA